MKRDINKKGFTLVELLAVIVVLAIVMTLAVAGISKVIDDARKNSFVTDALMFLHGAHQLVTADDVNNQFGNGDGSDYAPSCSGSTSDTKVIPLSAINLDQGGIKSPWGRKYNKGGDNTSEGNKNGSYIIVTSEIGTAGSCKLKYAIYITDGVHSIGTSEVIQEDNNSGPISEENVNNSKVRIDPKPPTGS